MVQYGTLWTKQGTVGSTGWVNEDSNITQTAVWSGV
jgi:hypothetical protein